jgi:hypothetical protein
MGVLEPLAHVHEVFAKLQQVARDVDIYLLGCAGLQIVEMQRPELLVNNGVLVSRSGLHIQAVILQLLFHLL